MATAQTETKARKPRKAAKKAVAKKTPVAKAVAATEQAAVLAIPAFLERKKDAPQPTPASEQPAEQPAPAAPPTEQAAPATEQPPVPAVEESETAVTEPFAVLPIETTIAGEACTVFQIDLGEGKSAGPFDTEAQAITYRDKHFAAKAKTGRKSAIVKTSADPGKMTDKYRAKVVTLVAVPGNGDKLADQAEGIVEGIRSMALDADADAEGFTTTQGEIVDMLIADAAGAREFCNTTQSPKRIWQFYRKALIEAGYISLD